MIESFSMFVTESITQFSEWLNVVSGGNQFLAASFIVVGSSLFYFCRRIPGMVYKTIKRKVVYRYEVTTKKANFTEYSSIYDVNVAANTINSILAWHNQSWWFKLVRNFKEHPDKPKGFRGKLYIPVDGTYFVSHKGTIYTIKYETTTPTKDNSLTQGATPKSDLTVTISTLGFSKDKVINVINEFIDLHPIEFPVELYMTNYGALEQISRVVEAPKSKEDNYIKESITNEIFGKIDKFLDSKDWYNENRLDYTESFLFHGLPGTGKSTVIETIIDHYKFDVLVFNKITVDGLETVSKYIKDRNSKYKKPLLVVIEDLENTDALISEEHHDDSSRSFRRMDASFKSQILNFFSGTSSPTNVIFIVTTNYPEKLDPAMMRRGRINHHIEIPFLTNEEIANFIKKNYNVDYEFDEELIISIADLIHYYKTNVDDFDNFIKEFKEFIKSGNKINLSSDDYVRELKGSNNEN